MYENLDIFFELLNYFAKFVEVKLEFKFNRSVYTILM